MGFSLDAQVQPLRDYCQRNEIDVVGERIDAESAKRAGRTAFDAMVKEIQGGLADTIVVEKTDRIYRNFRDRVTVGDLIDDLDTELHLVKESEVLNRRSPSHAKFVHDIKTVMAKNFIDNLSEEIRKGMREKASQGLWPSVAPIGYVNVPAPARPSIVPHPKYGALVPRLFEAYATGDYSLKQIAAWTRILGLYSVRGKTLAAKQVHEVLRNPIYFGRVRWNGEEFDGVHEPLVSRVLWEKVQDVMEGRSADGGSAIPKAQGEDIFAYRGLVTCGVCGCMASPYVAKQTYLYYSCSGARGCRRVGVREEAITAALAKELEGLRIHPEVLELLKEALKEGHEELAGKRDEDLRILTARRADAQAKLDRLYRDRVDGEVPDSTYRNLRPEYERSLQEIEREIVAYGAADRATWQESLGLLEAVSNSAVRFKEANLTDRRQMFKGTVSNCQIVDKQIAITLHPWFKLLLQANAEQQQEGVPEALSGNWYSGRDSNPRPSP